MQAFTREPPQNWTPADLSRTISATQFFDQGFSLPAFIYYQPQYTTVSNAKPFDPADPEDARDSLEPWYASEPYADEYSVDKSRIFFGVLRSPLKVKQAWAWSVTRTFTSVQNIAQIQTTKRTQVSVYEPSTITIETNPTQTQSWTFTHMASRQMASVMPSINFQAPRTCVMLAQRLTYLSTYTNRPTNQVAYFKTYYVKPTEYGPISYLSVNNGLHGLRNHTEVEGRNSEFTLGSAVTKYSILEANTIENVLKPYYLDNRGLVGVDGYGFFTPSNFENEAGFGYYGQTIKETESEFQIDGDMFPATTTTSLFEDEMGMGGETFTYLVYSMPPSRPIVSKTFYHLDYTFDNHISTGYNNDVKVGGVVGTTYIAASPRLGYTDKPAADSQAVQRAMASQHTAYSIENCQITLAFPPNANLFQGRTNGIQSPAFLPTWTGYAKPKLSGADEGGHSFTYFDEDTAAWTTASISRRGAELSSSWSWGTSTSSATGRIIFNGPKQQFEPYLNVRSVLGGRVHPHSTATRIVGPGITRYQTFDSASAGQTSTTRIDNWSEATWETFQVNSTITLSQHIPWITGIGPYITFVDKMMVGDDYTDEEFYSGEGSMSPRPVVANS